MISQCIFRSPKAQTRANFSLPFSSRSARHSKSDVHAAGIDTRASGRARGLIHIHRANVSQLGSKWINQAGAEETLQAGPIVSDEACLAVYSLLRCGKHNQVSPTSRNHG